MRESFRRATAFHEAGHAIAAWRLRVKLLKVTIVPGDGYSGRLEHLSPLRGIRLDIDGSDRARMKAENEIIVSLAGPAAQRRHSPRSCRSWHAASDYDLASDLALRLNGDGKTATAYLKWLGIVADNLVEGHWRFIERLAGALLDRGTLTGPEIVELLVPNPLKGAYAFTITDAAGNREDRTVTL